MSQSPADALAALRVDIDRIDAAMHALLMERGAIIERLIAVKARQGGGSAFRPGREAEMMRRIAERHTGPLPLDTVESIWRVIISTFTFVQSAYEVHADMAGGDASMRDTARFHFGFTVPLHPQPDAAHVVAAVARAENDLGIIPVAHIPLSDAAPAAAPWWATLRAPDAPKIIARLPLVERTDHPAGLPVFLIARPGAAAGVRDVVLHVLEARGALPPLEPLGASVLDAAGDGTRDYRLVAVDEARSAALVAHLSAHAVDVAEVGGHAARFAFAAAPASSAA